MAFQTTPTPFPRLMALRSSGPDEFTSLTPAWPPNVDLGPKSRAFGGHVYAQAVYAASKTVGEGLVVHNATGHFLLPGRIDMPFVYRVRRIRDGGLYCLRSVDVYQTVDSTFSDAPGSECHGLWKSKKPPAAGDPHATPCFIATISFKRAEIDPPSKIEPYSHQNAPPTHLAETYASVLSGKQPEDHPVTPHCDALWWEHAPNADHARAANEFPGVEVRKVDMRAFNHSGQPGAWRQLCFYRPILGPGHETHNDPNLTACAHAFASDRNSLFLIQRALGYGRRKVLRMGSLSHTVIFHGDPSENLRLVDGQGRPKWFVQEAWTSNSGGNRGCHESRLWDWEAGKVVATTYQDGMMRVPVGEHVPVDIEIRNWKL